ncbi:MAG: ATP-utilizing enzyme (ATP-grasp superfamily), partial [Euryarchaeota archaeon]|nr:ATP-utilizing enzyme (ATP-grasp superfamily) [Euryarchaeota archaeon]
MQIMVAEYASQMMPKLAEEGKAIRDVLCAGFRACGHVVRVPDCFLNDENAFEEQITRIAGTCDAGIVVAPDHLLYELTALLEANTLNLGCPADVIKRAADKVISSRLLREG